MTLRCIACDGDQFLTVDRLRGHELIRCRACGLFGYDSSNHHVDRAADEFGDLDLDTYVAAMKEIRRDSSRHLLDMIERHVPERGRLLDIGCSFGWFLDVAADRGWQTHGIEPSAIAAAAAREGRHQILHGEFPEASFSGEFDAVVMMDVLEHLPHGHQVLGEIRRVLRSGGVLVLKVPNRKGLVYRAAALLHKVTLGRADLPMWRMWQMDFPYPHVWYFALPQLRASVERVGFRALDTAFEPIVTVPSIPHRIRYIGVTGRRHSAITGWLYQAGLTCCALVDKLHTQHDVMIQLAQRA